METHTSQPSAPSPFLVDSHCHLHFEEGFPKDAYCLSPLFERAQNMGVDAFLNVATNLASFEDVLNVTTLHPRTYASCGVHPHETLTEGVPSLKDIEKQIAFERVVALGETGLDFGSDTTTQARAQQEESFLRHIYMAKKYNMPLIVHTRNADKTTAEILMKSSGVCGVLHCFTGGEELAHIAIECGFYLSLSGIITFKNASDLRTLIEKIPLKHLLVETDTPYLAPVPHRGRRNEPSFVRHTAEALAGIKKTSLEEIARTTTHNFYTLFNKTLIYGY